MSEAYPTLANPIVENIAKTNADAPAKSGQVAETIMKGSTAALTESGVQELTKAYQELATKNIHNLAAAVQALSAVTSPTEFIESQQKLHKDSVEAAVSDSRHIAQLTTSVFTAAFEPVKKQIEAAQKTARI
jgi:phasin family protein